MCMKSELLVITLFSVLCSLVVYSANILVIVPCPSRSHFDVFEPLMMVLLNRGHRLWVVSNFSQRITESSNYTNVDISGVMPKVQNVPIIICRCIIIYVLCIKMSKLVNKF